MFSIRTIVLVAIAILATGANAASVSGSPSGMTGSMSGSMMGDTASSSTGSMSGSMTAGGASASPVAVPKEEKLVFTFPVKEDEPSGKFTFVLKDGKVGVMTEDMLGMEGLAWHLHTEKLDSAAAAYGTEACGAAATAGHFGISTTMFSAKVTAGEGSTNGTPVGDISFALSDDANTNIEIGFKFTAFAGVTGMGLHPYDATKAADFLVGNEIYNVTAALANGALTASMISGGDLYSRYELTSDMATVDKPPGLGLTDSEIIDATAFKASAVVFQNGEGSHWVAAVPKALESGDLSTKFGALTNADGTFVDVAPFLTMAEIKTTSLVLHAADGARMACVNSVEDDEETQDDAATNLTPTGLIVALFAAIAVAMRA